MALLHKQLSFFKMGILFTNIFQKPLPVKKIGENQIILFHTTTPFLLKCKSNIEQQSSI